jgi:hypothetical protein
MGVGSRRSLRSAFGAAVMVAIVVVLVGCSPDSPTPQSAATSGDSNANASATPSSLAAGPSATPTSTSAVAAAKHPRLPGDPNSVLTPGATNPAVTQATIGRTICVVGWTTKIRPPSSYTTALKRQQIVAYGDRDHNLADYEEDHLISLEIGGAPRSPANLWPEPYTVKLSDGRSVGARVKDLLENRLHALVCAHKLSLAGAQRDIASDWIRSWFALSGQAPPPSGGGSAGATPRPTARPTSPPSGSAIHVTIASLTSPIARGSTAILVARTKASAACTILVEYKSGPSQAQGLGPKTASRSGSVSWSWTVGPKTTVGSWPVTVNCTSAGKSAAVRANLDVR